MRSYKDFSLYCDRKLHLYVFLNYPLVVNNMKKCLFHWEVGAV